MKLKEPLGKSYLCAGVVTRRVQVLSVRVTSEPTAQSEGIEGRLLRPQLIWVDEGRDLAQTLEEANRTQLFSSTHPMDRL